MIAPSRGRCSPGAPPVRVLPVWPRTPRPRCFDHVGPGVSPVRGLGPRKCVRVSCHSEEGFSPRKNLVGDKGTRRPNGFTICKRLERLWLARQMPLRYTFFFAPRVRKRPCAWQKARVRRAHAGVAQLVEHLICNQRVGGSSPFASSKIKLRNSNKVRKRGDLVTLQPNTPL